MKQQRQMILYIAMSLDGYIADVDGGIDWLYEVEGEGDNGYFAFYETVDTIIMGRTTYDQILTFDCEWPYSGKKCYVFTNREHAPDSNVEFVTGDIPGFMSDLKSQSGSNIWLLGGAELIDGFMKERLVDEFVIAVIPMILGRGIPLFKCGNPKLNLILREMTQFNDIVLLHYKSV